MMGVGSGQRWPAEVRIEMLATVSRMEEQD
jgi:hypothetical protein